jgi:hypothetical protein
VRRLPHKHYEKAQLTLFVGKRDMGKTYALRSFTETREPRVFALDPFNDFSTIMRRGSLQDAIGDMAERGDKPCRRRVVPPIGDDSYGFAAEFFALAIQHLRDCLIVMDEMTMWSSAQESRDLRKLVLQGRRMRIRMAVAAQRVSLLPGIILSESTEMMIFRLRRPRDLHVVEEWSNPEVAASVRRLEQGQCMLGLGL